MKRPNHFFYSFLARLVFLFFLALILFRLIDLPGVWHDIRSVPIFILAPLVAVHILRTWLTGLRWKLLNPDVSGPLTRWQYFRLMMIANAFNLVMPGALGGDVARTAMTMQAVPSRRGENLIAIVVDRFVGLSSIVLLGSIALFLLSDIPDRTPFYFLFGVLYVVFVLTVLLAGSTRLMGVLETGFMKLGSVGSVPLRVLSTWRRSLSYFRAHRARVLAALGLCLPIHGISFLTYYLLAVKLDMPVTIFDISAVLALVWVITSVPITIAGAGVRELSLIYLLGLYEVSPESATALSIYVYVIGVFMAVIGVGLWLAGRGTARTHYERV